MTPIISPVLIPDLLAPEDWSDVGTSDPTEPVSTGVLLCPIADVDVLVVAMKCWRRIRGVQK